MPRVHLPPGCMGFADGKDKFIARKPGGFVSLDDTDPVEARALRKLRNQDYASAGLVDAGPEKFFTVCKDDGRWCPSCRFLAHRWASACPRCGHATVPEAEMPRDLPRGPYVP
ncbi:MAG TPA: hypothetical protein VKV80_20010 [Streptosporangiaceae bacterium]|nr:hypothetical protein [Streptosporangiaceae bacterium]